MAEINRESKTSDERAADLIKNLEEIATIAQNGLSFATNVYDIERYRRLRILTSNLLATLSDLPSSTVHEWLSIDQNYATPKIDVRGVVVRGDSILLVQERSDGLWTLPGGWCDINQSPSEAVEKEVFEESGLRVEASRLLALLDKHKHEHPPQIPHAYKCFFLCHEKGGGLTNGTDETRRAEFFIPTEHPPLSLHRLTPRQLQLVSDIARDPQRLPAFD